MKITLASKLPMQVEWDWLVESLPRRLQKRTNKRYRLRPLSVSNTLLLFFRVWTVGYITHRGIQRKLIFFMRKILLVTCICVSVSVNVSVRLSIRYM